MRYQMVPRRLSHPYERGLGTAAIPTEIPADITNPTEDETWYLQVPYAQQVFSLVPAAAGVGAGLLLAQKFAAARATHVKASEVIIASVLSFAASFAVVFMIHTFKSYEGGEREGGSAGE